MPRRQLGALRIEETERPALRVRLAHFFGAIPPSKGRTILVVEEEAHIARLIRVNVERAGYTVRIEPSGKEGLAAIDMELPDMIILDLDMPDGYETLSKLRQKPKTRPLPILALSKKAEDADISRGCQSRVDCYLTKPFNPMKLVAFIQSVLS